MYLNVSFLCLSERGGKIQKDTFRYHVSKCILFYLRPRVGKDTFRYHVSKCIFLYLCTPVSEIHKDKFRLDTLEYNLQFQRKWNRMAIWKDVSENLSSGLVIDFGASLNCFVMDTKLSVIFFSYRICFQTKIQIHYHSPQESSNIHV